MKNEPQYLYLTTSGRKSGEPREIEIWFTEIEGRYYLIAEKRQRANWVLNIINDPRISIRVDNREFTGVGRIVEERTEQELWRSVRALYDGKYGWSDGLVVELTPEKSPKEKREREIREIN